MTKKAPSKKTAFDDLSLTRRGLLGGTATTALVAGTGVAVVGGGSYAVAAAVGKHIRNGLGLRIHVQPVPYGTLPSFEGKARRFTDHRKRDSILEAG